MPEIIILILSIQYSGVFGCPTTVANVETVAVAPVCNEYYYLLKIIQKFWLVKSGGWNCHIRSVIAQIWSYDIFIEYWKQMYDIMT